MSFGNTTLALRAASTEPADLLSPYGYTPTGWICYLFLVLFGLSGAIHLGQAIWFRAYWLLPTAVLCAIGEVLGWSGRLWSHYNVMKDTPFMIQISTTIISPTPLLAVNFILFGRIVQLLGQQYCLLSARWISILFISADVIALVIQGAGGGIASGTQAVLGGNIMLAGIAFQFGIMVIATLLAAHYAWSWRTQRPVRKNGPSGSESPIHVDSINSEKNFGSRIPLDEPEASRLVVLIWAVFFNSFFLFIRAIYRLIELSDGWNGSIITTEKWFNIFDATMVTLAIWTLNFAHPGLLLPKPRSTGSTGQA
ncbi:RTA1 like protein-domain-containing protein [Flagelloscypha sp. PMI_526]|nr:RTA1 like protein-domain-containing protein [Flagelloscypha sp. PMI_526]